MSMAMPTIAWGKIFGPSLWDIYIYIDMGLSLKVDLVIEQLVFLTRNRITNIKLFYTILYYIILY